jgi:dihydrodipicolinate synthase/N-acetylneuraminate lyase
MNLEKMKRHMKGTVVPVTTPFTKGGKEVNYDALKAYMQFYLKNGLRCFIAAGSTGQCYVLTESEHRKIVRTIVSECSKYEDAFVLGACSHTSTAYSNKLGDICQEEGSDALLLTPPYYRTHRDMCPIHYLSVAHNHDIPLVVYHDQVMPESMSLWDEFVEEPNIQGVKFATGNINMARELLFKYRDRLMILAGGSMLLYLPMFLHGSDGYVCSYANFMPKIENRFTELINAGKIKSAARIAELEFELFNVLGGGNWFNYVVALQNLSGLPWGYCREPLPDWPDSDLDRIKEFLEGIELKYQKLI